MNFPACNQHVFADISNYEAVLLFSERELTFTFAIYLSSVVCLSVPFVRPTQAVQMFGNISTALGTLAIQ